jgi:hypothetical protein
MLALGPTCSRQIAPDFPSFADVNYVTDLFLNMGRLYVHFDILDRKLVMLAFSMAKTTVV